MKHNYKKRIQEFTFILPAMILFLVFVVYPFLQGFPISFTKWDGLSPVKIFNGISNYLKIFKDANVWNATKNTLIFTALTMFFSNFLGLLFALMISKTSRLNSVLRTCIFVPYCLSLVLSSYIWRYVYSDVLYEFTGIPSPLGSTTWVMVGLAIISVWRDAGYCMVVYIAAIQGVSKDYYEAAELDGAGKMKQIWYITLPFLKPTIIMMVLLAVGKVFYSDFGLFYQVPQNSGALFSVTNTIDTYVYRSLIQLGDVGMASAAGVYQSIVGFILVMTTNFIVKKISPENALF